jgi:hypothetical protein
MKITHKKVTELIPYVNNSRTHSDTQVAQIAASIKEFGWTNPILVDGTNGIIAGHGRLLAARKLGYEEVPTIELADLTENQKKAYIIADNKLALNAGWDDELLKIELKELLSEGFAMDILGFDQSELDELFGKEEEQPKEGTGAGSLAGRFLIPPFSVLNAREGWWQNRKRAWLALGIKSEEGRGGGDDVESSNGRKANAAPGGSVMVAGYDKNGKRLVGLKNIGKSNG